jgi:hypothetical protein
MSDNPNPESTPTGGEGEKQTFTQADVDAAVEKIAAKIRAEERRKVSEKFADYDDLKAKAGEKATAEERIAALEQEIQATRLDAARARISAEFELTEKQAAALKYAPSEEAAREIAEGLAAEASERKKQHIVPREGQSPSTPASDERETVNALFG